MGTANVQNQLVINSGSLQRVPQLSSFNATVNGAKGPTPGALTISVAGTDIDFSELIVPGFCEIRNLGAVTPSEDTSQDFVTYGIWDGAVFNPLGEVGPGEVYVLKLSRFLGWDMNGGTGTTSGTNSLRFRANSGPTNVDISAFER